MDKMLFLLMMLLAFVGHAQSKSKSVSVSLETKWASTPLLLETSEFLASEGNCLFWKFVDSVTTEDPALLLGASDEVLYRLSLRHAEPLLSTIHVKLLKFALSLRYYSPAIAMYAQAAAEKKTSCEAFAEVNNMVTCEIDAMTAFIKMAANQPPPTVIRPDHHYPGGQGSPVVVILYAEIGTAAFTQWHSVLREKAKEGSVDYILRHYVHEPPTKGVVLSGYGVELAIKSTEYKAQDDRKVEENKNKDGASKKDDDEEEVDGFIFSTLKKEYPELKKNLTEFQQHLLNSLSELAPLKVWQLQDLSVQAAQAVLAAPTNEALRVLRDISQNFPVQARTLIKTAVKNELRREMENNQKMFESSLELSAGEAGLYINGIRTDLEMDDVFQVLDILRSEASLMEGLHSLGIKGADQMTLLKLELQDTVTDYAVDFRDPSVEYINDLEKDRKYINWPSSIMDLLRPTFPGMLRHIRKNMFHAVFIVNPAERKSRHLIKMVEAFYVHSAPIRMGLVFVMPPEGSVDDTQDGGVALVRAFHYVKSKLNAVKALSFITDVYDNIGEDELTATAVRGEFLEQFSTGDVETVFNTATFDINRQEASVLLGRLGLRDMPQVLLNGVPMKQSELDGDVFEEALVTGIMRMTSTLQKAVHAGFLRDDMDILEYVMTRTNVVSRLNARVTTPATKYLDFTSPMSTDVPSDVKTFESLSPSQMTAVVAKSMRYLSKNDDRKLRPITYWVVTDLRTDTGRQFGYEAVRQMKGSNNVRLGFLHNSQGEVTDATSQLVATAIQVAMETLEVGMAKNFITKLLKEENVGALRSGEKTLADLAVHNMDMEEFKRKLEADTGKTQQIHRSFAKNVVGLNAGQLCIIANGMVVGPLEEKEEFLMEDFGLLEKYLSKLSVSAIEKKVAALEVDFNKASELVMQVSALLMSNPQKGKRHEVMYFGDKFSVLTVPPTDPDKPAYDIVAVLDPVSRSAQKYTPLIMALQQVINAKVRVFMNCREKLSEMPLKSFYRYLIEPELTFTDDTQVVSGPMVNFDALPTKALLTLGMDPPESWLVESIRTPYDLDNIYLEEVENDVYAEFELEYLLLEGHCYDSANGHPPRGLQFILGTQNTPAVVDTIVMANLGYFQLKATPGSWMLKIRPGRSADIYTVSSHEFTDSSSDSPDVIVVMNSFKTKIIKVKVNKRPGKEQEDLLGENQEEKMGLWDSISNSLGRGTMDSDAEADKHLNIFSLASGHLYERFLRIMMLSVLKHTKSKVKFWFLKNYLSPSFKEFIPNMAKEYNFEYELVQYKWPRWLHQQTEKQRIIWGYKILFLDVLFPLSVNKFIFVDADQIVRADLQELHDLDLEGAPYGYTPFCDSRKEMDGFRFWKSGYWASHLAGRRYHISALYVVDLKKFRKIAAGDRLRGQYQGLSQDPNSLSNLDQDLPNNMIHQVAIKSLPQEWLWCETWCSNRELANAKTIDLCNNPLTKEPKLEAAVRIVSEWKDYDDEVKKLWDQWHKRSSSSDGGREDSSSGSNKKQTTSSTRMSGEPRVEL